MPCYSLEGVVPVVDPSAFVHPTAVLIGDVIVGAGCYVGPCASLRGDFGRIVIEAGANIQDSCILHGFPEHDTVVGENGHVGHGAVLHSCVVGRDALIGMKAVLMDEAVIGEQAFVAACSFVPAGMRVPARHLVAGIPARVKRELSADELDWKQRGTLIYQELTQRCLGSLMETEPLTELDAERPKLQYSEVRSLIETRRERRSEREG